MLRTLITCVDHAQVCHWSSHSALLTDSFLTCVRPTPLAGRLADAAYSNYVLTMLKSVTDHVTVLYFNWFLTFVRPTPLSAGRLADAACCIPKLCVAHAQGCHWSRHSALFQLFLNIYATYTIVGWQIGCCCMLHTQIMRCPRSRLSLITSQCFISTVS